MIDQLIKNYYLAFTKETHTHQLAPLAIIPLLKKTQPLISAKTSTRGFPPICSSLGRVTRYLY
uniref:Putative ovule protein n=1 Tax=Solanum chacoense TaxID=4108 RepID=A0A0V0HA60_SOLCH